ncbi:hypothetical protein [Paenibacillus sp. Leaf72]|uniref:hypothetical protein n=1 Tax=Paenibacillus sp. Leaf72 TaxID=1736234 RepID=UPI0006F6EA26|nr:hypothetical protein [Paenibacillus sp. Leaf72]KQN98812.1 hypothetical protein ASF12_18600 [Paenibacillus sp. Leaf72]
MPNTQKEALFQLIDEMIDADIDVTKIRQHYTELKYDAIRKRFVRTFGSYRQGLVEYGIYAPNGVPTELELARCYEITDNYNVVTNKHQAAFIRDLYALSETEFARISRSVVDALWTDAIDEMYRDRFPFDGISAEGLAQQFPHLRYHIIRKYGTFKQLLSAYKTPYDRFVSRGHSGKAARMGLNFERKLFAVLVAIYGREAVNEDFLLNGCLPDFVVNGRVWVDAKLSRETIRDKRCNTIEKYRTHTDSLRIYYARGSLEPLNVSGVPVRHVSVLYPLLKRAGRRDLIDGMEAFVERAQVESLYWRAS